ncbi:helix-turn-helix domain-containing protein [Variovorax sp. KK3]|uniref:helix-turn-helix domain-containing protein n=1 Tax=Variovorax sp. KK3 TaxID=1855728 RepID=UPI00097CB650|nr:helix-turn-helix domain-containing protein [Variovorax sp. KK3]
MSVHAIRAAPAERPTLLSTQQASRPHGRSIEPCAQPQQGEVFGRWLEDRIGERRSLDGQAGRVASAAMGLLEAPGLAVDTLARTHRVSRRQLERDFRRWLGMAPAAFARLVRLQRAACSIAEGLPLAEVAAAHGYADQAHMTRAFADGAGVTPRQVRERGAAASALHAAVARRLVGRPLAA